MGSSILDSVMATREEARERLDSGEMLLPEQEQHYKESLNLNIKRRKNRRKEGHKHMPKATASEKTVLLVSDLIGGFDPENPTKKSIKELRKALQQLSKECYPRKSKTEKTKKPAKKAAKKAKK